MKKLMGGCAIVGVFTILALFQPDAQASSSTWDDLRSTVIALVPPGPAQADLVARVDAIDFVYESEGSPEEIVAAYTGFVDGVGTHAYAGEISTSTGGVLLSTMEAVSLNFHGKIKIKVGTWLSIFGTTDEKCNSATDSCQAPGDWCIQFTVTVQVPLVGPMSVQRCVGQ